MEVPKVKYLSPSPHGHVLVDEATWQAPMRLTRCEPGPTHSSTLTYSQYFKGITDVISRDGYRLLVDATARQLARDISLADIEEILICAEKHGSDYHPARIEVMGNELCAVFVMNVAVTARGKAWLCRESEVLQYLNSKYDFLFLPRTYFQGEAFCDSGQSGHTDTSMLMFLADWFQGYHEFHLSIDKEEGSQRLVVWDAERNCCYLSRPQAWQIYHQAAKILTVYYDLETFEQIFPWHHAAGDFVVKVQHPHPALPPWPRPGCQGQQLVSRTSRQGGLEGGGFGWGWIAPPEPDNGNYRRESLLDVRLVTARQYAPMLEPSEGVSDHEALLFFLLNLSARMRLDRLDGVGAVAWADDECVDATLEGFLEGLRIKQRKGFTDEGFVDGFLHYLSAFAKEDLSYRFHALVDASDQAAPDIPVIRKHLERHIRKFHSALRGLILAPIFPPLAGGTEGGGGLGKA
jgi:hypothetical protein